MKKSKKCIITFLLICFISCVAINLFSCRRTYAIVNSKTEHTDYTGDDIHRYYILNVTFTNKNNEVITTDVQLDGYHISNQKTKITYDIRNNNAYTKWRPFQLIVIIAVTSFVIYLLWCTPLGN